MNIGAVQEDANYFVQSWEDESGCEVPARTALAAMVATERASVAFAMEDNYGYAIVGNPWNSFSVGL